MSASAEILKQICLDPQRKERNGFHEVIFCEGKSLQQMRTILEELGRSKKNIFGTRLSEDKAAVLSKEFEGFEYDPCSRTFQKNILPIKPLSGDIVILAAGSS